MSLALSRSRAPLALLTSRARPALLGLKRPHGGRSQARELEPIPTSPAAGKTRPVESLSPAAYGLRWPAHADRQSGICARHNAYRMLLYSCDLALAFQAIISTMRSGAPRISSLVTIGLAFMADKNQIRLHHLFCPRLRRKLSRLGHQIPCLGCVYAQTELVEIRGYAKRVDVSW